MPLQELDYVDLQQVVKAPEIARQLKVLDAPKAGSSAVLGRAMGLMSDAVVRRICQGDANSSVEPTDGDLDLARDVTRLNLLLRKVNGDGGHSLLDEPYQTTWKAFHHGRTLKHGHRMRIDSLLAASPEEFDRIMRVGGSVVRAVNRVTPTIPWNECPGGAEVTAREFIEQQPLRSAAVTVELKMAIDAALESEFPGAEGQAVSNSHGE